MIRIPNAGRCVLGWIATLLALLGPRPTASGAAVRDPFLEYERNRPPNLLLIVADDLGYGDLGCYGQTRIRTPHLDRLAAQGTRFTQFYAGSTVCAPSRAVLMTGLHTGHCRIRGNEPQPLLPEDVTVARLLDKAGYQTAAFGKWGLGLAGTTGVPNRQGFQEWLGFLDQTEAHNYYPARLLRNETEFAIPANQGGARRLYVQDLFGQAATNYLRTARFRPFFLYLPLTLPHANNERGRETGNGMEIPSDAPYSQEPWPQPEKNKAAMISRLDLEVGAILAALKANREYSNTLVLFTSDNGPHSEGGVKASFHNSSGGFRGIKRDLYEGGIRVPLIAWWPGHVPAGRVSDEPWAFWDLLPTLLHFARVEPPAGIDGISYAREMLGLTQTNRHEFFYWEFHEQGSRQAVRSGDWKAVRTAPDRPLELYDLKTDPAEARDLATANPAVIARMEDYQRRARTEDPKWPLKAPAPPAKPAAPASP